MLSFVRRGVDRTRLGRFWGQRKKIRRGRKRNRASESSPLRRNGNKDKKLFSKGGRREKENRIEYRKEDCFYFTTGSYTSGGTVKKQTKNAY